MTYRALFLEIVAERRGEPGLLQGGRVLAEAERRVGRRLGLEEEQALLTSWYDLFRTGLLSWGYNVQNPDPPFVHTTDVGRRALSQLSRDPYNPDGYLNGLKPTIDEYPIAASYISEAVSSFVTGHHRGAAVLSGAATESLVLAVRDALNARITTAGGEVPARLSDWRIKIVRDEIHRLLDTRRGDMDRRLAERFSSFFAPVSDQIRMVRNDAGHPSSIEPISEPVVHANLLLFPEFLTLIRELSDWVEGFY